MSQTSTFLERFSAEARRPNALPERLALYIAGMAYPDLCIENQLHILDRIAERVAISLETSLPGEQRALRFLSVINHEFEFDGNRTDYYDVRNSFLNDVLERRVGLPITLCVICMAVGRRLREKGFDISIDGLGIPSHFMTRYEDEAGVWLLDPFNGAIILPHQVGGYLSNMLDKQWGGAGITLPPNILNPVPSKMVALRMLNNLRVVFLHEENLLSAIQVLDYMLVLAPTDPELWRERGLLNYQCENWDRAERDLRRYFFLNGNLIATMGGANFELDFNLPFLFDSDSLSEFSLGNGSTDEDADSDDFEDDDFDLEDDDADDYLDVFDDMSTEEQNLLYILSDIEHIRARLN